MEICAAWAWPHRLCLSLERDTRYTPTVLSDQNNSVFPSQESPMIAVKAALMTGVTRVDCGLRHRDESFRSARPSHAIWARASRVSFPSRSGSILLWFRCRGFNQHLLPRLGAQRGLWQLRPLLRQRSWLADTRMTVHSAQVQRRSLFSSQSHATAYPDASISPAVIP